MNIFYVYALLDPIRKLPFYIGKGKNKRAYMHLNEKLEKTDNKRKWHRIHKIRIAGFEPVICKIIENVNETYALEIEKSIIRIFGRIGFEENGILTNLTEGGDGISGHRHSKISKIKMSNSKKGKKRQPTSNETKNKISESNKGKKHNITYTEEDRSNIAARARDNWTNMSLKTKEKVLENITYRVKSVEEKEKISKSKRGKPMKAEHYKNMLASITPERNAKISNANKGKPRTPEHTAAIIASRIGKPRSSAQIAASDARKVPWSENRRNAQRKKK
jgi:hypothetical protein